MNNIELDLFLAAQLQAFGAVTFLSMLLGWALSPALNWWAMVAVRLVRRLLFRVRRAAK